MADAVQGPLTAADVPLTKHGESLAEREALSIACQPLPGSARLKVTDECRGGPEEA